MKKPFLLLILLVLSIFITSYTEAAPPSASSGTYADPGAQLNRDRELRERLEIERTLREQSEKEDAVITDERPEIILEEEGESFFLNEVQFTPSEVLTQEELNEITEPYKNRTVNVQELYEIINKINLLYAEKGYFVCKAMLLEQEIEDGVVTITLVEGKTGEIIVQNNTHTKSTYFTNRLPLKKGEVANIQELNRDIIWFNGTNSVQQQIEMRAGKEPGTTDYYIIVYEPKHQIFSLFVDNIGFKESGEWRAGMSYVNRSVSGIRDDLIISGLGSESGGAYAGYLNYTVPITKQGTRFGINYSQNRVKTVNGPFQDLNIIGRSKMYGVSLSHPLTVNKKFHMETFLEWQKQDSKTNILGLRWRDDDIKTFSGGLSFAHYFTDSVLYHKHSYSFGRWTDYFDDKKDYNRYNLYAIYQKQFKRNHLLTIRTELQLTPDDYISSSDQFYIGGLYSVRGYEENLIGADNGVFASIEYSIPIQKAHEIFCFFDYGKVWGDNAFKDDKLYGTGVGWRWNFMKDARAELTVGIPLKRDINGERVDSARFYFLMNKQF